jgi:hypothetical protein
MKRQIYALAIAPNEWGIMQCKCNQHPSLIRVIAEILKGDLTYAIGYD